MLHRKTSVVAVGLVVLALTCGAANADFDEGSFALQFPDDPGAAFHTWSYDYDQDILNVDETLSLVKDDRIIVNASTNDDPNFNVDKTVENTSGVTWTAYDLVLETDLGDGSLVVNTATSDLFAQHTMDTTTLHFFDGEVPDGASVNMVFDINVASIGTFTFTVTQTPVPEPASLSVLAVGALALLRRRRRS